MAAISNRLPGWTLHLALAAFLTLSLAACGGSSSSGGSTTPPPASGNDDDDDDDNGSAGVSISPQGDLGATEPVVVVFESSMDPDSLELDGSLADSAEAEWSTDNTDNDTLTLTPAGYWAFGNQTLSIDVRDDEGEMLDSIETEFDVASAFTNFPEASVVIGQADFNSGEVRQGSPGADANTLDTPIGPVAYAVDEDILFIPDNGSSRVLAFNGIPEANNMPADFVIGQPDLTRSIGETSAGTYRNPQWITTEHDQLLVSDSESRRVLVYNAIPQNGPVDADIVVGQQDMEAREILCDQRTLYTVHGHFVTPAGRLFVADSDNNRVLMWNQVPESDYAPADLVLGQPDFSSCNAPDEPGGSTDMRTFNHPTSIWSDDERVVIVDNEHNRVLLWNEFPADNFAEPDIILGQQSFDNVMPNDDDQDGETDAGTAISARVVNEPWDAVFHNGQLFVSDQNNNRVLIWNGFPESSFQPADIVIGQPDMTSGAANAGNATPTANSLNRPRGVAIIGDRLFITDMDNSRMLVYNIGQDTG